MSRRSKIQTSIQSAVEYWSRRIDEDEISTDWREADTHCWRCGCQRNLERCHIVPHTLGGTDEPSNIVLLCKRCHREGPNVTDPEIMWDWIRAYRVPFLETFWIIRGAEGVCVHLREAVIPGDTRYLQPGVRPAGYSAGTV